MYEWVEHTSELELRIEAETPEEVLREALRALAELLGPADGEPQTCQLGFRDLELDLLLWHWLDELTFLSETERFVPEDAEITIEGSDVRANVFGRMGDPPPLVKAVTLHNLAFEKVNGLYRAQVVLDV